MFNKFSGEAKTAGLGTLRLTSVDVSRMPLEWKTSDLDRMNQMISAQDVAISMGAGFPEESAVEYYIKSIDHKVY